tara:strand:- start:56 stop:178 length:123 start_codon:yes stop_codon:yes gene_type:complete
MLLHLHLLQLDKLLLKLVKVLSLLKVRLYNIQIQEQYEIL